MQLYFILNYAKVYGETDITGSNSLGQNAAFLKLYPDLKWYNKSKLVHLYTGCICMKIINFCQMMHHIMSQVIIFW